MLPEALLLLLSVATGFGNAQTEVPLNSLLPFSAETLPKPPAFGIPQSISKPLTITVALCSIVADTTGNPRFFLTNSSAVGFPGPGGGRNVYEIVLVNGYGNWSGVFPDPGGGVLSVQNLGMATFELGVSDQGPIHESLPDLPLLGDTTSNQAVLFSPPFSAPPHTHPRYPNYTFPPANLPQPTQPDDRPNFAFRVLTTSNSSSVPVLHTGCALTAQSSAGKTNESLWLPGEQGWRTQWLVEGLVPSRNYTAFVIKDRTKVAGPIYFATKSATFSCPLVHNLPFCPSVAYPVPLPVPPVSDGGIVATTYTAANLPQNVTTTLLSYMANFTVTLGSFACGRDAYSPLVECDDCARAYRHWLCAVTFTRCGEPSPARPDAFTATPAPPGATGISAIGSDSQRQQEVLSALVTIPLRTNETARSSTLPPFGSAYEMLLPCLEVCNAVDRACPAFLGFTCPRARFNAGASYGVGYVDGANGEEGKGVAGTTQDQWGNVWCNGG